MAGYNSTAHAEHHDAHAGEHHSIGTYVVFTIALFLLCGNLIRNLILQYEIPIPYTVCLIVLGVTWGIVATQWGPALGIFPENHEFIDATTILTELDAHLFLLVFIPPLIFESAFSVNYHTFERVLPQALLLAGPGILLASFCSAGLTMLLFRWDFVYALLFGAMISATDPVAVVALLRELGASKKLATLIEAESLMNDGTAFVLYVVVLKIAQGGAVNFAAIVLDFFWLSGGGILWGEMMGRIIGWWLSSVNEDFQIEMSLTIGGAFFTFWIAMNALKVSEILAVVQFGLFFSRNRVLISPHAQHALHHIWEWLAYVANTLIFCFAGVIVSTQYKHMKWSETGIFLILYTGLHVIRAAVVFIHYPLLRKYGYGVSKEDCVVLTVGGLRGAIGLALAMLTVSEGAMFPAKANRMLYHCCGVVLFTLCVNATVMPHLISYLGLNKLSEEDKVIFHQVIQRMVKEQDTLMKSMKCDPLFHATNWEHITDAMPQYEVLKKSLFGAIHRESHEVSHNFRKGVSWGRSLGPPSMITRLETTSESPRCSERSRKESKSVLHPPAAHRFPVDTLFEDAQENGKAPCILARDGQQESNDLAEYINMCDDRSLHNEIRHRVLATVKSSYWHQFHEGMISEEATKLLVESVEVAMDSKALMAQWQYVERFLHVPFYLRFLYQKKIPCLQKVVTWKLCDTLAVGIEMVESFRSSYDKVANMYKYFPEFEKLPMARLIVEEGEEVMKTAKTKYLTIKHEYSDVYCALMTHQAATYLLNQQTKEVEHLHNAGVIEDKEHMKLLKFIEQHFFKAQNIRKKVILGTSGNFTFTVFKNLSWISHFDDHDIRFFYDSSETMTASTGEKIHSVEDDLTCVYLIIAGTVLFKDGDHVMETRECGQPLGLIAKIGHDSPHCDFVAETDVLLLKIPDDTFQFMLNDSYCYKSMCHMVASLLLNQYFRDFFKHETSVETNTRVQHGKVLRIKQKVELYNDTQEGVLIKGTAHLETTTRKTIQKKKEKGPCSEFIVAPALLLPGEDYTITRGSVVCVLAPVQADSVPLHFAERLSDDEDFSDDSRRSSIEEREEMSASELKRRVGSTASQVSQVSNKKSVRFHGVQSRKSSQMSGPSRRRSSARNSARSSRRGSSWLSRTRSLHDREMVFSISEKSEHVDFVQGRAVQSRFFKNTRNSSRSRKDAALDSDSN